jgi:hypothetical protein
MNLKTILQILLIQTICLSGGCQTGENPVEIWISPGGDDHNPGTREQPMASLSTALRKAREMRRLNDSLITDGVHIILKGGVYRQHEPVLIRPEDSGSEQAPTVIQAAPDETPIISGGMSIGNWEKPNSQIDGLPEIAQGQVWVADIPMIWGNLLDFRQVWVNNKKAVRASSLNDDELDRILSVDSEKEEIWIPKPQIPLRDPLQLEFIIHQWWAIANLRVKTMDIIGDKARLTFHQPESRIEFEHPWPAPFIDANHEYNGNSAFFFANAIELLNQPGEWFRDLQNGKIYYWPLEGEDMTTARVIVPFLETLIQIEGTLDNPVQYLAFRGLAFEHTTWMRPSEAGHVPLQAGMFLIDAYKLKIPGTPDKTSLENQAWIGRQPAGVALKYAANIVFDRCSFAHMAATGLDFLSGTNNCCVEGCIFTDIGGTAIQLGFFGNQGFEAHVPYRPSDPREACHHVRIANNFITDGTNEDWGCVGISVGYAHDINIEHNEVSYLNYSGICIGWGWTRTTSCMKNNRIHANHIHHFARQMYDVGGIYTLSAQPNTDISNNSIHHLEKAPYAHIPDHYQYIYLDEGSSYIRVINNWTEKDKFFSNSPGPGNEWINNGTGVSDEIRNSAGLQPEYRDLLNRPLRGL